MRIIAIGDVHGCASTLRTLVETQVCLEKSDELYFLGDLIDRGPDSKGVIDFIFELWQKGYKVTCLKGNHEDIFLRTLAGESDMGYFHRVGGDTTLKSFGVKHPDKIPARYLNFFAEQLEWYAITSHYIFVHAGLNTNIANPFSDKDFMIWQRNWYEEANREKLDGHIVVHGHDPISLSSTRIQLQYIKPNPFLNLDNGCFMANYKFGMGFLTACDLTNKVLYSEFYKG